MRVSVHVQYMKQQNLHGAIGSMRQNYRINSNLLMCLHCTPAVSYIEVSDAVRVHSGRSLQPVRLKMQSISLSHQCQQQNLEIVSFEYFTE